MLSKAHVALGLALTVLTGSVVEAQAGGVWGVAHYETPAPTPEPAPIVPPATAAPDTKPNAQKRPGHERAAQAHRRGSAPKVGEKDVPPAPTPTAVMEATPLAGPIEPAAPTIRDLVTKHARANGIPEKLASAVVTIESRFNPKARGGSALGLMQIKYDTARSMGYAGGVTALLVPETNLHFGMRVLADAYKASNGDVCMTLARYQSGHRVTHASAANRAYCARARSLMARAS